MSNTQDIGAAISLPKGGGALSGIGETFAPNLFTGTGNLSVPIAATPGRNGFGPQLSLQYSTGNGNGPFGFGWSLNIPRIHRKTEKGLPRYTDGDVFVLSGAEDLAVADTQIPGEDQPADYAVLRYRPRTEGLFTRIEKWTRKTGDNVGDTHWRIVTKDNVTNRYGYSPNARIADPDHSDHVYEWLLEESMDARGNHILYEYVQENLDHSNPHPFENNRRPTQTYIRRILYGNTPDNLNPTRRRGPQRTASHPNDPEQPIQRHYLFELLFDYGDLADPSAMPFSPSSVPEATIPAHWPIREDPFSTFRSGFEIRTLRRCRRVLMLHHFAELEGAPLVRSTDFEYAINPDARFSLFKALRVTGYRHADGKYLSSSLPPLTFTYSQFAPHRQRFQSITAQGGDLPPRALDRADVFLVDLFGDAMPDIVQTATEGVSYYWRNRGAGTIDRRRVQPGHIPSIVPGGPHVAFADMGGDGLADLVVDEAPLAGFFESTPQGRWKPFRKFDFFPTIDLGDPDVRLIDLTGDGLADILVTRDHHFLWYPCLGEAGYGAPRHVPRVHDLDEFPDVYFSDPAQRVRMADMSGDGLSDIVMIHDRRIDYWPNLGYGRFGRRIVMLPSPDLPDRFNPRQVFLVDLDGTGCADLVCVESGRVHFWFNQSGNGWSDRHTISGTPPISDASAIQFADFFGTGTASLIWSDDHRRDDTGSHYRVLDFCGGRKPHLLTEMDNHMGATTRVEYAPSTRFYLEDEAAGKPWATHLPFPVQVVAKTEVIDHISHTKLVSTFRYHHGYFDGREREFRGFGRVDRMDTETVEGFAKHSLHEGAEGIFKNGDRAHYTSPVLTKTWFHSGVYFDEDNVSPSGSVYDHKDLMAAYAREFYAGDHQAAALGPHQVERAGNPHEAYRALRGAVLHSEVYALDETNESQHPYTVTANRYHVTEQQAAGDKRRGVYLTTLAETLSYHYERNPQDPRIAHEMVLAVDDFGQVTDSVSIAYPRRKVPPDVPEQGVLAASYKKTDYINRDDVIDLYYLGIPCQARTFEVTGISWSPGDPLLRADHFAAIVEPALVLGDFRPFQWQRPVDHPGLEKRLVEWQRSYFRTDASAALLDIDRDGSGHPARTLAGRLPLGEIQALALPYERYTAVFTDDLLAKAFDGPAEISEPKLRAGGYHREPDVAGYWWSPSGQEAFDATTFFLPSIRRDPFGFDARAIHDGYGLAPVQTVDAVGNTVSAKIDYRVLQPHTVAGPNGNRSVVVFDALGLVTGSAVMGKEGEGRGDRITETFQADLSSDDIGAFTADPHSSAANLLGTATTRIVCDLHRFHRTRQDHPDDPAYWQPSFAATLARETHAGDPPPGGGVKIQIEFAYSDGFGRIVQSKVQAEPDPAAPALPRWVGTGTTVFNNKGKPVRQYEPFFSGSHAYGIERHGTSPTLFYDPLARVVATLHPNHTYEKVVFDPWRQESWDVNDTILQRDPSKDPDVGTYFQYLPEEDYLPSWHDDREDGQRGEAEKTAARRAAAHAGTPSVVHLDSLGRPVLTVADNGDDGKHATRAVLDIQGNTLAIVDAKGRTVMQHRYDMHGTVLNTLSMEAGARWALPDVAGNPLYGWDSRGHRTRHRYDERRRPVGLHVTTAGQSEVLAERTIYGEGRPDDQARNLRDQVYQTFDAAGIVTNLAYDFKGNLLRSQQQLLQEVAAPVDWTTMPALEAETFASSTRYDALNRPIQVAPPHSSQTNGVNVIQPVFNDANLLDGMHVWTNRDEEPNNILDSATADLHPVVNIDYDAKGQRERIVYGNQTSTVFTYDPDTYRLIHLETTRSGFPTDKRIVQDLHYAFEPVGNITTIRDDAQQTVFFNNAVVEPTADYWYDALYRLVEAHGREHLGQTDGQRHPPEPPGPRDGPRAGRPHPGDGRAMGNYIETYLYDAVGNIEQIAHRVTNNPAPQSDRWTRQYEYNAPSLIEPAKSNNRLSATRVGSSTETYPHDAHGNMTRMPHLKSMERDFKDQLHRVDREGGGEAWYVYDAGGERVRKVVKKNNGSLIEEWLCLGGVDIYRRRKQGDLTLERQTLHIIDDTGRIALVETKTVDTEDDPSPVQTVRYQYGNHLGSSSLELDDQARIISYEEYFPYGSTAYQAVNKGIKAAAKRYRYTGKERDDETGLYYHGARYYASWLGRWTAADPAGLVDGVNIYGIMRNNPLRFADLNGEDPIDKVNSLLADMGFRSKTVNKGEINRIVGTSSFAIYQFHRKTDPKVYKKAEKEINKAYLNIRTNIKDIPAARHAQKLRQSPVAQTVGGAVTGAINAYFGGIPSKVLPPHEGNYKEAHDAMTFAVGSARTVMGFFGGGPSPPPPTAVDATSLAVEGNTAAQSTAVTSAATPSIEVPSPTAVLSATAMMSKVAGKKKSKTKLTPEQKKKYRRPTHTRKGFKEKVWFKIFMEHGEVVDPESGLKIDLYDDWELGHKPGYEFWKHQVSAARRGISEALFRKEYFKYEHFRPEIKEFNASHTGEIKGPVYFGE